MFDVEVDAAVRHFVFIEGNSRREAARVFGLSRERVYLVVFPQDGRQLQLLEVMPPASFIS